MDKTFRELVIEEMHELRMKNGEFNSWHEAYGVLLEEVEEFWKDCKKRPSKRNPENALRELVQIAAIAECAAYDLTLPVIHKNESALSTGN